MRRCSMQPKGCSRQPKGCSVELRRYSRQQKGCSRQLMDSKQLNEQGAVQMQQAAEKRCCR